MEKIGSFFDIFTITGDLFKDSVELRNPVLPEPFLHYRCYKFEDEQCIIFVLNTFNIKFSAYILAERSENDREGGSFNLSIKGFNDKNPLTVLSSVNFARISFFSSVYDKDMYLRISTCKATRFFVL